MFLLDFVIQWLVLSECNSRSSEFGSQRRDSCANINDFEICNKYDIDNTGLVCKLIIVIYVFLLQLSWSSMSSLYQNLVCYFNAGISFIYEKGFALVPYSFCIPDGNGRVFSGE